MRGKAGSPRVSSAASAPTVHEPIVELAEVDSALRRRDAGADQAGEASFGPARPGDALIVDLEVRVLALRDAERRLDVLSGPVLNVRSTSIAARRVPPQVSGTDDTLAACRAGRSC